MQPSQVKFQNVTIGDLQSNPRGGKVASILNDGKPLKLKLRGVQTPFQCSSYDKTSTRRALDIRTDKALRDFCSRLDAVVLPHAKKLTCSEDGYKSLAKAQKEGYDPLFRQKITLDDQGKSNVKFFDETRKRMTPAQISEIDWKDVLMDINVTIGTIFVNAGNWGCVATPTSILIRTNEA